MLYKQKRPDDFIRFTTAIPKVVLPEPDSPTIPSVSPRRNSKLTRSTALISCLTLPQKLFLTGKRTSAFSTESTTSLEILLCNFKDE